MGSEMCIRDRYLKRLIVGGFEKIYEINRNFRNEGVSSKHNPEFTMIEFYQTYADYSDMMNMTEKLLKYVVKNVKGNEIVSYQKHEIDFGKLTKIYFMLLIRYYLVSFNIFYDIF